MPSKALSDEIIKEAKDAVRKHGSVAAAARALGIPRPTLQHRVSMGRAAPVDPKDVGDSVTMDLGDTDGSLVTMSPRISTLEEALAKGNVDTDVWRVQRFVVNSWEQGAKLPTGQIAVTPLWQIKVWLERKQPLDSDSLRKAFIAEMRKYAPCYKPIRRPKTDGDIMAEISCPDLHLAKLCWQPETGENYDLPIAINVYEQATDNLLGRVAPMNPTSILLPVGNDLLHVDNKFNTTTAGTPQDCDGRWQKSFVAAHKMLVRSIDKMATVAPVRVIVVPGNHDKQRSFYLGEVLSAWYNKSKAVTVDNTPTLRKYVRHGAVLLGFTHGDEEPHNSLESIMIRERPSDFAEATHREIHLGHLHKKKEVKYVAGDTHGGTVVRILPSLTSTDAWHYSKGFVKGPKAAEAYVWSKTAGYVGHLSWSPTTDLYLKGK